MGAGQWLTAGRKTSTRTMDHLAKLAGRMLDAMPDQSGGNAHLTKRARGAARIFAQHVSRVELMGKNQTPMPDRIPRGKYIGRRRTAEGRGRSLRQVRGVWSLGGLPRFGSGAGPYATGTAPEGRSTAVAETDAHGNQNGTRIWSNRSFGDPVFGRHFCLINNV